MVAGKRLLLLLLWSIVWGEDGIGITHKEVIGHAAILRTTLACIEDDSRSCDSSSLL